MGRTKQVLILCSWVVLFLAGRPNSLGNQCPSVLVIFTGSSVRTHAEAQLCERLVAGGAKVTYAERAQEVVQQYVVQVHETLTNTRSGRMTFKSEFQGAAFSQRELATSYAGVLSSAEQYKVGRGTASYTAATLSARQYTEFQRQAGFVVVDYGEETEYTDWYNSLVTDREQRAFWQTIKTWNADVIVMGVVEVFPVGRYGGLVGSRAVVSARVIDVRGDRPSVLRSLGVVTNAVDLSETAAGYRALSAAIDRVAEQLSGTVPCYTYVHPPALKVPLGAIGIAVVDVKGEWVYRDTRDQVRRIVEAGASKYPGLALYTRSDLEAVLAEQRFSLSGLVENPVEAGRLGGVRYLLLPTVTELDVSDQHYYIDVPILRFLRVTIRTIRVGLFLSLVDVQSGRVLWSSERARSAVGVSILGLEFNMSPLDQFRRLAGELLEEMYETVVKRGVERLAP